MNRERIAQLRDHMNTLADSGENRRFNWNHWTGYTDGRSNARLPGASPHPHEVAKNCNTCACVAGWAGALFDQNLDVFMRKSASWLETGSELLGITVDQAIALFSPGEALSSWGLHRSWDGRTNDVPPRAVALVLDHLLNTGIVDWSVIGPRRCFNREGEEITA